MNMLRLIGRQLRYENLAFWRNPASAFFTFAFPLIFMVLFNLIFSSQAGGGVSAAAFFTPAIVAFSVVNACYTTLAMTVSIVRDEGILKHIHGTPLPTIAYLAARIVHSALIALLLTVIVTIFGIVAFGVSFRLEQGPLLLLVLLIGAGTFCALGLAVAGIIPNASAAPAVVNASILPILFISDVFVNLDDGTFLAQVGNLFPVRHLATALQVVYDPFATRTLDPVDLVWLVAWGTVGIVGAMRTFSWEPRT